MADASSDRVFREACLFELIPVYHVRHPVGDLRGLALELEHNWMCGQVQAPEIIEVMPVSIVGEEVPG
jgi:hypothetical protein